MDILNFLVEPLTLPFMLRAFVVTVLAAAVCALLSCWLVLLGWSLMGDAISHAVLPGVVLAYIFGAPFAVGAVVAALVAVAPTGGGAPRTPNLAGVCSFSSILILTTFRRPSNSAATSSKIGAIILHGPHQGAQKSNNTGTSDCKTSRSKSASPVCTINSLLMIYPFLFSCE